MNALRTASLTTLGVVVATMTACSSSQTGHDNGIGATCTGSFDMLSTAEPLGARSGLDRAVSEALGRPEEVSVADLTHAAGWSATWDRVVVAKAGITRERMNQASGLQDYCWPNLPTAVGSDGPAQVFYVFFDGGRPLQSIRTDTSKEYFHRYRSGDVLRPDTRLEPVPPRSPGSTGYFQPA
ncbi:hypothetical protein [Nocardia sputorum]|uniref:Lipoprotein n=1 Tax=Nocardia sputorum TaxID=2984338 RepID=A0ABN6TWQ2_9NOCA|nr:hypothetical protein [Nocardia sputorum]BDT95560.1 hypothetical protein IFM12275_55360 [Nocardia sputorum]BDT97338.1 hypothetical protein IFM12276_03670 [Nocardia sputorum]